MDILRKSFDKFYEFIKPSVFWITKKDPEKAHELFIEFCKLLSQTKLENLVLDNKSNYLYPPFVISNAGGFNKNGDIPPSVLKYLGFDRGLVGTVTYDSWEGNSRPRIIRYPKTESMLNWMGLPGIGAQKTAEKLFKHNKIKIPLTINIMATPGKKDEESLEDLEKTVLCLREVPYVDRFELNISCPNTFNSKGNLDSRKENQRQMKYMLEVVKNNSYDFQDLDLKVSPDLKKEDIESILEIAENNSVKRLVISNTSRFHNPNFILGNIKKGGASGKAVYDISLNIQKIFYEKIKQKKSKLKIIACGGIDSLKKIKQRVYYGAEEIQIYTPFIFKGPKLLRIFRQYNVFHTSF